MPYREDTDCDGDGVADPWCRTLGRDGSVQEEGFFGSAGGCVDNWPSGTCRHKPATLESVSGDAHRANRAQLKRAYVLACGLLGEATDVAKSTVSLDSDTPAVGLPFGRFTRQLIFTAM